MCAPVTLYVLAHRCSKCAEYATRAGVATKYGSLAHLLYRWRSMTSLVLLFEIKLPYVIDLFSGCVCEAEQGSLASRQSCRVARRSSPLSAC